MHSLPARAQPRRAPRPPARAGLLSGLASLLLSGCIVPFPIEAEEPTPPYPPFLRVGFVQPPVTRVVVYDPELDPDGAGLEFSTGPLGDPNDDRLFWRWFYNYGPGSTAIEDASPIQGLAAEQHESGIRLRVRPCTELRPRFPDTTIHRIELLVADQPFLLDGEGEGTRNQVLPADAGQLRVVWYLTFDAARCPL